jgi:hypothetical protein
MAYLNQPWFNRKIINTIAMATGAVPSKTLTIIKRASKRPQQIPVTPFDVDGVKYGHTPSCITNFEPSGSSVRIHRPIPDAAGVDIDSRQE